MRRRLFVCAIAGAVLGGILCVPASAIVRRDDVADSQYTALAASSAFDSVGWVTTSLPGSGTLVANNWVLTAAHVGERGPDWSFTVGGETYDRAWFNTSPGFSLSNLTAGNDICLVRLSELVFDVTPATLYTGSSDIGQVEVTVGYGRSGTGTTGATGDLGTKRAGRNVWDVDGSTLGWGSDLALADFDSGYSSDNWWGSRTRQDLEFCAAEGDSGGGSFIEIDGQWYLAGVTSFVAYRDSAADSDYGDATAFVRVSSHLSWILSVLNSSYTMVWTAAGDGDYNSAGNWYGQSGGYACVPGFTDVAKLQASGSHVVTLPGPAIQVSRLLVSTGSFTLDLAGSSYAATSTTSAALVVGDAAGTQDLTFTNGTFTSPGGQIAAVSGSTASLTVGSSATWNATDNIYVGGTSTASAGTGTLTVEAGGSLAVSGEIHLWSGGTMDWRGGSLSATQIALAGGALAGTGSLATTVVASGGTLYVADGNCLDLTGSVQFTTSAHLTKTGGGTLTINGTQSHGAGATLTADGGTTVLASDAGTDLAVTANAHVAVAVTQHLAGLSVGAAGSVKLEGGSPITLGVDGLSIASGGSLDLAGNEMWVYYTGSPETLLAQLAGWTNDGSIVSTSDLDADKGIGYADRGGYVQVRQTWLGDATLDGSVNGADLAALATNWGLQSGAVWADGDFNGDGMVNGADLATLATNWNKALVPAGGLDEAAVLDLLNDSTTADGLSGDSLTGDGGDLVGILPVGDAEVLPAGGGAVGVAALPEPGSLLLLTIGGGILMFTRRRVRRG